MRLKTPLGLLIGLVGMLVSGALPTLAQVSNPSIIAVTSSPQGQACTAAMPLRLLVPGGILFTCQGGVWASTALGPSAASLVTTTPQTFSGQLIIPDVVSIVRPVIDVRAFGAICNGTNNDTSAINSAITAASRSTTNCGLGSTAPLASCTGVVEIPNLFCYATQILMQNNVTLQGTGWNNSGIVQIAGANEDLITNSAPATNQRFELKDLFINGNSGSQTGTGDCVHFDSTGALSDSTRSPRHTIENVFAANCKQDAIAITGDAGSEYLINVKGMNSGRFGLNLNVFDSHVDVGEFASNGTAGINLGTNGNGSVASVKTWGNGPSGVTTGTVGDGIDINSGNWRIVNLEAQDNVCNGLVITGASDNVVEGLLVDGNGNSPSGGDGCAGVVLNGANNTHISGEFRAQTDAGKSDYAIAWVGSNQNNTIDMPISQASPPAVGSYSGTIDHNTLHSNSTNGYVTSTQQEYLNGLQIFGFSDTGSTRTWRINSALGAPTWAQYTVATLPSAATAQAGAQVIVTDGTATGNPCPTGGGTLFLIAISNGSTWSCH